MTQASGKSPTEQAQERIAALRDQAGIKPSGDGQSKPAAKALKTSLPDASRFEPSEAYRQRAEALNRERAAFVAGRERRRIDEKLRGANLPQRHAGRADLTGEKWTRMVEKLVKLAGTGYLCVLIGDRGRGKTQAGVQVAKRYILDGHGTALYGKAMDFFMDIRETYRRDSDRTERDVMNGLGRYDLLVIDAAEVRSDSAWEDRLLSHLIDGRYDAKRDTLIIGNIKADQVTNALGHSIVSRADETGGLIVCDWQSYREVKK